MKLLITVLKMKSTSMTWMDLYKRYVCLPYFKNDIGGERRIDFNFRAHLMRLK